MGFTKTGGIIYPQIVGGQSGSSQACIAITKLDVPWRPCAHSELHQMFFAGDPGLHGTRHVARAAGAVFEAEKGIRLRGRLGDGHGFTKNSTAANIAHLMKFGDP